MRRSTTATAASLKAECLPDAGDRRHEDDLLLGELYTKRLLEPDDQLDVGERIPGLDPVDGRIRREGFHVALKHVREDSHEAIGTHPL